LPEALAEPVQGRADRATRFEAALAGVSVGIVAAVLAAGERGPPLQSGDHGAEGKVVGRSRQGVAAGRPAVRTDEVRTAEILEDLGQESPGDQVALADLPDADVVTLSLGHVDEGDQAVLGSLRELDHRRKGH